ncbi:MAG: glycosyltransferase family 4 protein [Desulfovibrio sp.]|nr:glycosyltransferase family 4 protein [Desulfovibrio sp.]
MNLRCLPHFFWYRMPVTLRSRFAVELFRCLLKLYRAAVRGGRTDTRRAREGVAEDLSSAPCWVVGFFTAPTGLGQGARLFYRELKAKGADVRAVDVTFMLPVKPLPSLFTEAESVRAAVAASGKSGGGNVVVHANPPAFMMVLWLVRRLLPSKRVIAYWAWEFTNIPVFWKRCLDCADEILVPSSFVADALRRHTTKPVRIHPHAALPVIRLPKPAKRPFTVLTCFDAGTGGTSFYRKNPLAVVAAFKAAFADSPETQLILKITDADRCVEGLRQLLEAVDCANIRFCLGRLTEQGMAALYAEADAYIALHRSEGYGLTIQEAVQHGLPVIASGWSGNMDFMRGEGCFAVPCTLVPVCDSRSDYGVPGTVWAEADVGAAAAILRDLRDRATQGMRKSA